MHLSHKNLYDYFSIASSQDSAMVVGKKLFDFVDRQSNMLIVTIGDSWSWGADLTQVKNVGLHDNRLQDDDYRIKNVYGNVLADSIDADYLNLGESGSGNWYIDKKLQELSCLQGRLAYDRIFVIGVFTELGRDFNSHYDVDIDYRSWLLQNVKYAHDYYNFLSFVNENISLSIIKTLELFDDRYRFFFSTNFVDPIGYDLLDPWWLPDTWLKIICATNKIDYKPNHCYMVFPWVIEKFQSVFGMAPELDRLEWLKWMNDITNDANLRAALCAQDNINFGPLLHPVAKNHACWAKYLLGPINAEI